MNNIIVGDRALHEESTTVPEQRQNVMIDPFSDWLLCAITLDPGFEGA